MLFDFSIPKQFAEADLFFPKFLSKQHSNPREVYSEAVISESCLLSPLPPYQAAFQLPEILLMT